ncbi:MAG: hypothetical protein ACFFEO_00165 [Candidatus Thorarchaeota archaeon]
MSFSLFNLEKIKELKSPINDLQIQLNKLNEIKKKVIEKKKFLNEIFSKDAIIDQYEDLIGIINHIDNKLLEILKINVNLSHFYNDNLIEKYKENIKQKLKLVKIDENLTKKIGINLIENKKVSKIINKVTYISSITLNQWVDIIDSLKQYSIFLKNINKVSKFYNLLIQEKLDKNLIEIPQGTDENLIQDYKQKFLEDPNITFFQFIQNIERRLSTQDLTITREFIKKNKEKEEIEKLKKKQQEQQEAYENYLILSNGEFERLRRKKKRQKLKDVSIKQISEDKIEIPEDVSKKIEEFKSQFESSFKHKKFVEENENKDPLELIRERKNKKEKEYKKFKKHIENT